jgi:hypothetical protein
MTSKDSCTAAFRLAQCRLIIKVQHRPEACSPTPEQQAPLTAMLQCRAYMPAAAKDPSAVIGRAPEDLKLEERLALTGKFIALEIYTPEVLPLRRIEAIGDSIADCVRVLRERGLEPARFEFSRLPPPY